LWSIAKALRIPIDSNITELTDIPYTISYTIRKRQQIDNFNELPKDKRPPDKLIWDGNSDELDDWLERVFKNPDEKDTVDILITDIEE
jgi:hypothetical protein